VGSAPVSRDQSSTGPPGLRKLLGSLLAAVAYLTGTDLVVEFANDEFCELLGGRDISGRPLRAAVPELAGQGLLEALAQALRSGEPSRAHEAEVRLDREGRDEQVFLDYVCQPVPGPGPGCAGVLLFAADVTSTVRARENSSLLAAQLTATEDRYRTLFRTLPDGVIYYSADGLILAANPAARQILGLPAESMRTWPLPFAWQAIRPDGSRFGPEEIPVAVALRTGEVVRDVALGIPDVKTGEQRWLSVTGVPDSFDARGRPQRAYAIFRDLTRQRRLEAAYREGNALMERLRDANLLGVVLVGEDRVHEANDAFLGMVGYQREDLRAGLISRQGLTPPESLPRDADAHQQLMQAGAFRPYEKQYVHRDGHRVPVLVGGAVVSRHPLRWVTYVVDLSAQQRAEQERAALRARERAAQAEAERSQERLGFLLRAGHLLAAGRDRHELLQQASQLVVPGLADFCVGFAPGPDGRLRGACLVHRGPGQAVHTADLRGYQEPQAGWRSVEAACATGLSQLVRDATAELGARDHLVPPVRAAVGQLQPDALLVTPLMAGPRALGVLALGRAASRGPFSPADIDVVEGLARQLAVGLANADKSARDHSVAETLQRAVLPGELPDIDGLDLAVRYLPGTYGVEVGGDWYDAFPLADGRIGLAIGDVVGHGIASASVMGQVRNLLRAYAVQTADPAAVLDRTRAALAQLLPDAMVTVAYAVLDPATGELSYANAGHPPPVGLADGQVGYLEDADGIMFGVPGGGTFTTGRWRLEAGACLLLYTDGLVEARHRDIGAGFAALADAMHGSGTRTARQTCAAVEGKLLGTGPRADDVCLLVVWAASGAGRSRLARLGRSWCRAPAGAARVLLSRVGGKRCPARPRTTRRCARTPPSSSVPSTRCR
jgi:PAS domain S-box-containing protein